MELCSLLHTFCEICMAAGGIGTVGTLVYMIYDSKRKARQIQTIQHIQSHQLETLYEPDIRIDSYGSITSDIGIHNYSENLVLLDILELSETKFLNKEGMAKWFPYPFDKDCSIKIPLYLPPTKIHSLCIEIVCRNRLGVTYKSLIDIHKGKPIIKRPIVKQY